jgi:hypothetical protein
MPAMSDSTQAFVRIATRSDAESGARASSAIWPSYTSCRIGDGKAMGGLSWKQH